MADTTLKTDYKDDVLDTSKNTRRKYQMIQNDDGTVSFVDVTEYSQVGDSFGAADINATNKAVSDLNTNISALNNDLVIKNDTLESATTLWTIDYGYAHRFGKFVKLTFYATATGNSTTIQIKNFKTLYGDYYRTPSMFWDDTNKNTIRGMLESNDNNLCIVFETNKASGTGIRGDFIVVLK